MHTNTTPITPLTSTDTGAVTGAVTMRRSGAGRARWAAFGAAVAVALGGGGVGFVHATITDGERPVLVSIEPCRLVDTRVDSQVGPRNMPIGTAEEYDVAAHGTNGNCTIPATASALSLNVTTLNATAPTNVRIFAADAALPTTSNLNPVPGGAPAPNAVTTDLDASGAFTVFNEYGSVDVIVDVNGYYEDHNHDDRYLRHDQVMWAVVEVDGSISRSSTGLAVDDAITSQQLPGTGEYVVTFPENIANCSYQATVGRPGVNVGPLPGYAMVANWIDDPTHSVIVFTKGFDGTDADRSFHLTLTCLTALVV
jgi:hypothetical protein